MLYFRPSLTAPGTVRFETLAIAAAPESLKVRGVALLDGLTHYAIIGSGAAYASMAYTLGKTLAMAVAQNHMVALVRVRNRPLQTVFRVSDRLIAPPAPASASTP